MSETPNHSFTESLPGNPYIEDAESDTRPATKAVLAMAYELRTQTLMAARGMTDSITDEVIARRLGFTTAEK